MFGGALLQRIRRPDEEFQNFLVVVDQMQVTDFAAGQPNGFFYSHLKEFAFSQLGGLLAHFEHRLESQVAHQQVLVGGLKRCGPAGHQTFQVAPMLFQFRQQALVLADVGPERNRMATAMQFNDGQADLDINETPILAPVFGLETKLPPGLDVRHQGAGLGFRMFRLDVEYAEPRIFLAGIAEQVTGGVVELEKAEGLQVSQLDGVAGLGDDGAVNRFPLA